MEIWKCEWVFFLNTVYIWYFVSHNLVASAENYLSTGTGTGTCLLSTWYKTAKNTQTRLHIIFSARQHIA